MSSRDEAEKAQVEADETATKAQYKAARERCDPLSGTAKDVCIAATKEAHPKSLKPISRTCMNDSEAIKRDGEYPLYDAVNDLSKDDVESIVRKNAAEKYFVVKGEHLKVINTLIDHYKKACKSEDCLAAHEHMRFLENEYADKGGSKYLYMLFAGVPDSQGVLSPIHELAGLPSLRLQADKGFGTAF